jgi:hypothetical protein
MYLCIYLYILCMLVFIPTHTHTCIYNIYIYISSIDMYNNDVVQQVTAAHATHKHTQATCVRKRL